MISWPREKLGEKNAKLTNSHSKLTFSELKGVSVLGCLSRILDIPLVNVL